MPVPSTTPGLTRRQLCGALALAAVSVRDDALARAGADLPLAVEAPPGFDPAGYLVSEKFDGVRALWDGRVLRFRSGRVVHAPRDFLVRLPGVALDGELWLGRGAFEPLSGLVRRDDPQDADWRELRYLVFELPGAPGRFDERAQRLREIAAQARWPGLEAVAQTPVADAAALQARLEAVVRGGGEGLMLHRADAPWLTGRTDALRKLKPVQDAEAVVLAHLPGRGRHAGRLGALRVRGTDGVEFQIGTGFSDAQREAPPAVGSTVTYAYRGRTGSGVPRFASFVRLHEAW